MSQTNHNMRLTGSLVAILGYSLLANHILQSKSYAGLGALLAIAPALITCVVVALKSNRRLLMLGLLVLCSPLFWLAWQYFKLHFDWAYWLMHESLQFLLLATFARTLLPGQEPLCTQFARVVHGSLSPAHIAYARKVTVAWALFFALVIIISNWLFFFHPIKSWSIFINFAYLPMVAMMFVVEYAIRKRVLPNEDKVSIMEAVHAFMNRHR